MAKQPLRVTLFIMWFHYVVAPLGGTFGFVKAALIKQFFPPHPVIELTRGGIKWVEYVRYFNGTPWTWGYRRSPDWGRRDVLSDGKTSSGETWRHLRGPRINFGHRVMPREDQAIIELFAQGDTGLRKQAIAAYRRSPKLQHGDEGIQHYLFMREVDTPAPDLGWRATQRQRLLEHIGKSEI